MVAARVDVLACRFKMTAFARRDVCPPQGTGFQKRRFLLESVRLSQTVK
jgi:hypothetical protein